MRTIERMAKEEESKDMDQLQIQYCLKTRR
jgi:hypothetical protein